MYHIQIVLFFVSLIIAAYLDLKNGTIPDWLTLTVTAAAIIISFFCRGLTGLAGSMLGWAIGFFPFYVLHRMGGMGGGDVKLMGMVGALGGAGFIIYCYWYTALVGLIMALGLLLIKGKIKEGWIRTRTLFHRVSHMRFKENPADPAAAHSCPPLSIPYGMAIVTGAYITFFVKII
ncbi:MAG: prepilin peptidase [Candidatus Aureabacteria bacterium]|nr:prepilin peptidase [Candidatus Auribacterota bacterium]